MKPSQCLGCVEMRVCPHPGECPRWMKSFQSSVAIRAEVSPLGMNGLVKLTCPDMPNFSVVGKSVAEVYEDAPLCIAALVNIAQGTPALASAIEAQRATTVQQGVVHESAVGSEASETPDTHTHSEAPDNG